MGKSTIARTVARDYYDKDRTVASYFFSRGGGDASNATKFVGTIAKQLAGKSPEFKKLLRKALSKDEGVIHRVLKDQWRELVTTPLAQLPVDSLRMPVIIVVDALDECDTKRGIIQVVQLLAGIKNIDGQQFRVLITSRPEAPIREEFSQCLPNEQQLILQDISQDIVNKDISLFLQCNLAIINPEDEVIEQLVERAAGLFVWAATACRFICQGSSPEKRLHIILGRSGSAPTNHHTNVVRIALLQDITRRLIWNASYLWFWMAVVCGFVREGILVKQSLRTLIMGNATPEDHLDKIYLTVLDNSLLADFTPQDITDFHGMVRDVLGSIVVLFSPLSVKSLSRLLLKKESEVTWTMKDLHAVLHVPKNATHALRLHHPSFREFLLSSQRCCDSYFWVDEKLAHRALFDNCLRLLSKSLKQDICELKAPGMLAAKVESDRVEQYIPPELQYACRYWVGHLEQCHQYIADGDTTHLFLQKHFLHWVEAMSLMGESSRCVHLLDNLRTLVTVRSTSTCFLHTTLMYNAAICNCSVKLSS
jgi:hypothetical protein